jgi:plasmid maintenance system antidote protein VapI
MQRIYEITGATTQKDLATALDVSQPTVSVAQRSDAIPASWIVRLVRRYGVSPEWIQTGEEPRYLAARAEDAEQTIATLRQQVRELSDTLSRYHTGV